MIIDLNETPGGLASTDVTPEGFVSCDFRAFQEKWGANNEYSFMMLAVTSFSHTTNILMTVSMKLCPGKMIGISINVSPMFDVKTFGFHILSKITFRCYPRRSKLTVWMV